MEVSFSALVSELKKASAKDQPLPVCVDSRKVTPGSVFVALKGCLTDGHRHLMSAQEKGAKALVVQDAAWSTAPGLKTPVCVVPNTRWALGELLNHWYDFPSHKMFCVAVTGTNGKTTTSQMIAHIFASSGWRTGLTGTVESALLYPSSSTSHPPEVLKFALPQAPEASGHFIKAPPGSAPPVVQKTLPPALTTPDPLTLYALLDQFYKNQAQAVVMEASSIGLDQERMSGVDLNIGVFTNLSEDHTDYHLNRDAYFQAKKKLFQQHPSSLSGPKHFRAVLNFEDPYGVRMAQEGATPYVSYGLSAKARFYARPVSCDLKKTVFHFEGEGEQVQVELPFAGDFNILNGAAALSVAHSAGFSLKSAGGALSSFKGVSGRLQPVEFGQAPAPTVFVDYAHTPDALDKVLQFLKTNKPEGSRLIVVFGCGGERDQLKRPQMTRIAESHCDLVILTSDNPRSESAENIVADGVKGLKNTQKVVVQTDRRKAIFEAIRQARPVDVVLIAGKGHETTQIVGENRHPFDDRQVALQALKTLPTPGG